MSEDNDFFAAPPSEEFSEQPIILGAPTDNLAFAGGGAEEAPAYVGELSEVQGGATLMEDGSDEEPEPVADSGPSPMQQWNAEWQELLLQRKDEENAKKAEFLEAAKIALEEFQQQREQKRESRMAKNREDEQAKLEAIEADLENDNSWQRVCKMVELTHDSTKEAADVKRMRDVMILLKNETAKAELLA